MAFATVAAGTAAVGAGLKIYQGLHNTHQANVIERNNMRPTQIVQPEYQQNVNQAEQMAQQGLPQQQYNNSLNNINTNLTGGLFTLGRSANPSAGLASLLRAQNGAVMNLDAQSAQMRNTNLLNLMRQRSILAQQKQLAFDYNNKDKYSEQLAKSQALRGAGIQNLNNGASDLANTGGLLLSRGQGFGGGIAGKMSSLNGDGSAFGGAYGVGSNYPMA